ncbi:transposase (fragment) [Hyella patelloides LEGE 07179]|uniref:Transposase n=1 Tax=Hyella patelloides LEGE 07179 TaxID=945734 RepID=A0A563VSW3_9CYAN
MKLNWQPEELIEHCTLISAELDLLTKKTAINRLGIALLLKYFQYEGHFPTSKAEISRDAIRLAVTYRLLIWER